jgi:DNA polymerase alpha subunit B
LTHPELADTPVTLLLHLLADKKLTVSVLGGSISAGIGAEDAPAWVDRLEQYLKDSYGKVAGVNVTVNNGAVPGTTSAYMAACVKLHVPKDADIVIIDYSVNDEWQAYPPLNNPVR